MKVLYKDHQDLLKENCGKYSDEQGERFHQDLMPIEKGFNAKTWEKWIIFTGWWEL